MAEDFRPTSDNPKQGEPGARWITRLLFGLLGATAVARTLAGSAAPDEPGPADDSPPVPQEEEVHYPDGRIEHPRVRHEGSDINVQAILWVLLAALCLGALTLSTILRFHNRYAAYQDAIKRSSFPLSASPDDSLPKEPRLEQVDRMVGSNRPYVYQREQAKEELLHSYGRAAQEGFVHIPIERAMDILARKGLPTRDSASSSVKQNGLVDSGESNSGRMFRKEARWFER
jgi:hypothetical protein